MKIVIIGAGAHAGVILDILKRDKHYTVVGFTDDSPEMRGKLVHGLPVLGDDSVLEKLKKEEVEGTIVGLGYKLLNTRIKIFEKITKLGLTPINAIHPKSIISDSVKIGKGVVIMAGAIINPYTKVGDNVVINTGAIIDHDNLISDHAFVNPGAKLAGNVKLGRATMVGMGASIAEGVEIGENCIIGACSLVLDNIPANSKAIGIPAKVENR